MRILYAVAGMMIFTFILSTAVDIATEISNNTFLLALAIVFAGGMAGGEK